MLLGTLDATLLWNILANKGMNRAGEGVIRAEDGTATKRQGRGIVRSGHAGRSLNSSTSYENKMNF